MSSNGGKLPFMYLSKSNYSERKLVYLKYSFHYSIDIAKLTHIFPKAKVAANINLYSF